MGLLALLLLMVTSSTPIADRNLLGGGYSFGGSELPRQYLGQEQSPKAGSGISLFAGHTLALLPYRHHQFEGQLTLGLSFTSEKEGETSMDWIRWPFEALYFYRNTEELFRVGWGATYQFQNSLRVERNGTKYTEDFDNALGWVVAAEKLIPKEGSDQQVGLGIRYQWIKYKSSTTSQEKDGNGVGVNVTVYF